MRYRVKIVRVQQAERVISASNEGAALKKLQDELTKPYGFLGHWETVNTEAEVLEEIPSGPTFQRSVPPGGPLLMSIKDAAKHLGVSSSVMYELVRQGDVRSVTFGRRKLIRTDELARYVEEHSSPAP